MTLKYLMQVFFKVTEGQVPIPEWEAKLEKGSKKFVALKDKAISWGKSKFGGQDKEPAQLDKK